jgi:hypothetical protein
LAKTIFERTYSGRAPKPVDWRAIEQIFDVVWGADARSLPRFPSVIGGIYGMWRDAGQVEHKAASLAEIGEAYDRLETSMISLHGSLAGQPDCYFVYWPARAKASIDVRAEDAERADDIVEAVSAAFPLVDKYVFVSYATSEYELAVFVANLLEERLDEGVTVFVAKRDVAPGSNPLKEMLEQQLLKAEALIALCSKESKQSAWLWWEASAVWARGNLVIPLFVDVSPTEFDGPLTLVCQGRKLYDVADLESALRVVVSRVSPARGFRGLTADEVKGLGAFMAPPGGAVGGDAPG